MKNKLSIKLITPAASHKSDVMAFREDWLNNDATSMCGTSEIAQLENYEQWLSVVNTTADKTAADKNNAVPAETFFAYDKKKLIGIVNIRLKLNPSLTECSGGHIYYGVKPSERGKGYSALILEQGLVHLIKKDSTLQHFWLDLAKGSIAGKKTIEKFGGVFVKEGLNPNNEETISYELDKQKFLNLIKIKKDKTK